MTDVKPPLGLFPKKFYWEQVILERINQIDGAIERYVEAGLQVNPSWNEERNMLITKLKEVGELTPMD